MTYLKQLKKWEVCSDGYDWAADNKIKSITDVWKKCEKADWLMWSVAKENKIESKRLTYISALIAETVLPIYEKQYPNDMRIRKYIQARKNYAIGKITEKQLEEYKIIAVFAVTAARYVALETVDVATSCVVLETTVARAARAAFFAATAATAADVADVADVADEVARATAATVAAATVAAAADDDVAKKKHNKKIIKIIKQNITLKELTK